VDLVDEEDREPARAQPGEHRLEPFLEIAPEPRAGQQRGRVESEDLGAREHLRHVVGEQPLSEPLGQRRLADAGITDEDRVVLAPAAEDLERALQLDGPTDQRVELTARGTLAEVDRVCGQRVLHRAVLATGWAPPRRRGSSAGDGPCGRGASGTFEMPCEM